MCYQAKNEPPHYTGSNGRIGNKEWASVPSETEKSGNRKVGVQALSLSHTHTHTDTSGGLVDTGICVEMDGCLTFPGAPEPPSNPPPSEIII